MKAISTSSVEAAHGLLDIVHLKVYVVPAAPLKLDVALDEVVIVPPAPLMMLHAPVPDVGILPARVTLVNPQVEDPIWSAPALAVVGITLTAVAVDEVAVAAVQPFEFV